MPVMSALGTLEAGRLMRLRSQPRLQACQGRLQTEPVFTKKNRQKKFYER